MMGSAFTLTPDTSQIDLTITMLTVIAIIVPRTNIAGTGTIIGTITIEIMIGTTTGIDVERYFLVECSFPRGGMAANAIGGPAIS